MRMATLRPCRALRKPRTALDKDFCVAAIIGIRPGHGGNDVLVMARLEKRQTRGDHMGQIDLRPTESFVSKLQACAPDIHTRIIILQDSVTPKSEDDRAVEALLNSHILGIGLDLVPAYVRHLSQRNEKNKVSQMRRYQHPILMDACVNFDMSHGQSNNVALYLGRKIFGDGSPHIGKCI